MSLQTIATSGLNVSTIRDKKDLIKTTIAKGCSDDQFELFANVCERTGLDPFLKQIYAIMRNTKDGAVMTIQTSIDGLRLIADRTGNYCPGREPTFTYTEKGDLLSATSFCKKMTKDGTWHEFSATAHFDEYCPLNKEGNILNDFWKSKGHIMLAKCAEALALRKGWPAEMCHLYTKEEMDQADPVESDAHVVKTKSQHKSLPLPPKLTDDEVIQECIFRFKDKECDDFPVSEYLDYCAKICKPPTTIRNIAEQALQRIDSFAETYKKWADMKMDEFLKQNKRPEVATTV